MNHEAAFSNGAARADDPLIRMQDSAIARIRDSRWMSGRALEQSISSSTGLYIIVVFFRFPLDRTGV